MKKNLPKKFRVTSLLTKKIHPKNSRRYLTPPEKKISKKISVLPHTPKKIQQKNLSLTSTPNEKNFIKKNLGATAHLIKIFRPKNLGYVSPLNEKLPSKHPHFLLCPERSRKKNPGNRLH
jgi:hypothetical protein